MSVMALFATVGASPEPPVLFLLHRVQKILANLLNIGKKKLLYKVVRDNEIHHVWRIIMTSLSFRISYNYIVKKQSHQMIKVSFKAHYHHQKHEFLSRMHDPGEQGKGKRQSRNQIAPKGNI